MLLATTRQAGSRRYLCCAWVLVAIILLGSSAGCASPERGLEGIVTDASTGTPLAGAVVTATWPHGNESVTTNDAGRYRLDGLAADASIVITAERYQEARFAVGAGGAVESALQPVRLQGSVRSAYSAEPLAGVLVSQGDRTTRSDASGAYELVGAAHGQSIKWQADGYKAEQQAYDGSARMDVQLRPTTLSGRATAKGGKPVAGATITLGERSASTDSDGRYLLRDVALPGSAVIRASGYETLRLEVGERASLDVELQPFEVRSAYLTYYGVGDAGLRNNVLRLLDTTELNAVVIDVKGDFGKLAYKSAVPLAKAIGADDAPTIADPEALLADLKTRGVYTIARIVVFKDDMLGRNGAAAGADVAVRDSQTDAPWVDGENLVWVDPFRPEVWDYNVALAAEAVRKGFDEVQFDYIRFPTDPSPGSSIGAAVFSRPSNEANRIAAVEGFLAQAQAALRPLGGYLSVDVFGYTCWREDDMGIGQDIVSMAKYVDFISPMVYPSTYSDGLPMEPNYANAPAYPYEIVFYSVKRATERLQGLPVKIRPWLQYFDDYPWASGIEYNAAEIVAQIRAASEAGGTGYLLWDPTNRFARGGLDPR